MKVDLKPATSIATFVGAHFGLSNHRHFLTWVVRRWRGRQPLALGSPKPIEHLNGKVESALGEKDDSVVLMFAVHC
jgi:hypothetical protein